LGGKKKEQQIQMQRKKYVTKQKIENIKGININTDPISILNHVCS
jgi:hypothetical protein